MACPPHQNSKKVHFREINGTSRGQEFTLKSKVRSVFSCRPNLVGLKEKNYEEKGIYAIGGHRIGGNVVAESG